MIIREYKRNGKMRAAIILSWDDAERLFGKSYNLGSRPLTLHNANVDLYIWWVERYGNTEIDRTKLVVSDPVEIERLTGIKRPLRKNAVRECWEMPSIRFETVDDATMFMLRWQ